MFKLLLLVAFAAVCFAQTFSIVACPPGVGLSPWQSTFDTRDNNYDIACADGSAWEGVKRGITGPVGDMYTVKLRSLGQGITRQGFRINVRFDSPIQLVSACIADEAAKGKQTWGALKPGNVCRGNQWSSRLGSPFFVQSLDESGYQLKGWQVKNPPRPTSVIVAETTLVPLPVGYTQGQVGGEGLVACNFYLTMSGSVGLGFGIGQILPATETGLASYMGWYSSTQELSRQTSLRNRACWPLGAQATVNTIPSKLVTPSEISAPVLLPSTQKYGSLDSVVQSFMTKTLSSLWDADEPAFSTVHALRQSIGLPVVMYANFPKQTDGALGFQLGCAPSEVDETKYVFLTFWGGLSLPVAGGAFYEYFCYPDLRAAAQAALTDWDARAGCVLPDFNIPNTIYPAGMPQVASGDLVLRVTCQNVETATPTPLKWATASTIPAEPFEPNSVTLVIEQCERRCDNQDFQKDLSRGVENFALAENRAGARVFIECIEGPLCTEPLDTIALNSRRGLKQNILYATSIPFLMKVTIVTRSLSTANDIMNAIRAGNLNQYGLSAFSNILMISTNSAGRRTSLTVVPVAAAFNIAKWPQIPLAEWSGRCYVYGPCREGGCTSGCNNGQIVKTTEYSTADIFCICNACSWSLKNHKTQYFFYSDKCATSGTKAEADVCCRNVMQDAVCWLVAQPELLESDYASLSEGLWAFRAPNIGSAVPDKLVYNGPTNCPSSSSSPKGLLGLLGLLGIIPCCLCLLSLLLCFLRRKKREGDVHFATFDAGASCAPACAPTSVCAPVCGAPSFAPMSYQ